MDKYELVTDNKVIETSLHKTGAAKREALMAMEREGFGEKRKNNKIKNAKRKNSRLQSK